MQSIHVGEDFLFSFFHIVTDSLVVVLSSPTPEEFRFLRGKRLLRRVGLARKLSNSRLED